MRKITYLKLLEDFTQINFNIVLSITLDIYEKLQLSNNSQIRISWKSIHDEELIKERLNNPDIYTQSRKDALNFIKSIGVIKNFESISNLTGRTVWFDLDVDIEKFRQFKKEVEKLQDRKTTENNVVIIPEFNSAQETKWEDIKICFKDGHTVEITILDKKYNKTYRELGFEDKRNLLPNKQWQLLDLLSHKEGELSWDNPEATNKVKHQKFKLSKKLKEIFKINDDPFYPYEEGNSYRLKIKISSS